MAGDALLERFSIQNVCNSELTGLVELAVGLGITRFSGVDSGSGGDNNTDSDTNMVSDRKNSVELYDAGGTLVVMNVLKSMSFENVSALCKER